MPAQNFEFSMKVVWIDYWSKKIWVSSWETSIWIAHPIWVFWSKKELFEYLETENPDIIVLWIPYLNHWDDSTSYEMIKDFAKILTKTIANSKVEMIDERMSSKAAKSSIKKYWFKEKYTSKFEDAVSAQLILETYFSLNGHS